MLGSSATLVSPGPVRILWSGMEIEAAEMDMDTEKGLVHLSGGVQIRDGGLLWKLEEAVYGLQAESMDFFGNVILEEEAGSD